MTGSILNIPVPMVITVDDTVMAAIWDPLSIEHRRNLLRKTLPKVKAKDWRKYINQYSIFTWARLVEIKPYWANEIRSNVKIVIGRDP